MPPSAATVGGVFESRCRATLYLLILPYAIIYYKGMKSAQKHGKKGRFGEYKIDRHNVDLLLNLRWQGWSYGSLSQFFGVNKDVVKYHCVRYGVFFDGNPLQIPPVEEDKKDKRWRYEEGEKVNKGKSYADYLKDLKHRPPSKRS